MKFHTSGHRQTLCIASFIRDAMGAALEHWLICVLQFVDFTSCCYNAPKSAIFSFKTQQDLGKGLSPSLVIGVPLALVFRTENENTSRREPITIIVAMTMTVWPVSAVPDRQYLRSARCHYQFREFAPALLRPAPFLSPHQQSGIHCLIICAIQLLTPNNLGGTWRRMLFAGHSKR